MWVVLVCGRHRHSSCGAGEGLTRYIANLLACVVELELPHTVLQLSIGLANCCCVWKWVIVTGVPAVNMLVQ